VLLLTHYSFNACLLRRRIALHKYDPKDLLNSFDASASSPTGTKKSNEDAKPTMTTARVSPSVDVIMATPTAAPRPGHRQQTGSSAVRSMTFSPLPDESSPISVLSESSGKRSLGDLERGFGNDDDDSDDELL
jgi:hypothetical protein